MKYIKMRNWDKWQTYRRDRGTPPWIKVHRRIKDDANWASMSDAERGQLVAMWLLAADRDGYIPSCPKTIRKLCMMESEPDLARFQALEFLEECQDGVKVTPTWRQDDAPEAEEEAEAEAETETKKEKKNNRPTATPRAELLAVLDDEHAAAVLEHRQRLRKPLTAYAAKKLAKQFALTANPNEAADTMIARGWQGFEADWILREKASNGKNGESLDDIAERIRRELGPVRPGLRLVNGHQNTEELPQVCGPGHDAEMPSPDADWCAD